MIDTAAAKQLLQSSDIQLLKSSLTEYRDYMKKEGYNIDGAMQMQLIKLLILLYNRLLQVQSNDPSITQADIATTYAGIAYSWNLMSDGERCQGQIKKALDCDPNCIDALTLQSELHSGQARFGSAIVDMQKVITILKDTPDAPKYALVEAYLKLSAIHEMMGSFDASITVLKDAISEFTSRNSNDDDTKQIQLIKIELYGRLGTIQEKIASYHDAVDALSIAVSELTKCYGPEHAKTQEMEYILDMAISAKKG
jgi:tetratricopeptide (TPR) repeat protein